MKKYFYSVLAAGMLFATSCSQDQEIVDITKGEGQKVTFKVEIPEEGQSRAINVDGTSVEIGKGQLATKLIYAQYEAGATDPVVSGYVGTKSGNSFTVNLTMAKDINYDVLFLAYNPENNIFGISPDVDTDADVADQVNLKSLTLKNDLQANQEVYDAFVGALIDKGIKDTERTVKLTRPFAQVNAVTTKQDLEDAAKIGITGIKYSKFIIEDAPNTYNIYEGKASGEVDLTYGMAPVMETATTGATYPYEEFATDQYYLATAYVLVGESPTSISANLDATFQFYRGETEEDNVSTLPIAQLPIQRNYRTNVIGNLLTKTEEYTVTIEAGFAGDHDYPVNKSEVSTIEGLQAAINNAIDNVPTTITLMDNIIDENGDGIQDSRATEATYWVTVPSTKDIIIDLNGYTLSQEKEQTAGYQMILNDGNLTIMDSKGNGKISYTDSGNGGEYISDAIYNRGVLVINGGTIENLSSATVANNGYPHAVDTYSGIRNTSVTINGGTIYCAEYSAIRMFCVSATNTADLVINGGTIKGAIDMQNGSKDAALGTLTINDGTFNTTKNANNIRFANWNGGATEYGITAAIKGGSFNGGITTAYVPEAANWNKGIVSGGIWGVDVTEYVAEGYSCLKVSDTEYHVVYGITFDESSSTYTVSHVDGLTWISDIVDDKKITFEGQTIQLDDDIDLYQVDENGEAICFDPIGSYRPDTPFKGTFDGQNHTIKNLNQNTWALNNGYYYGDLGLGLFGKVQDATIKNLVMDNANISGESALCGVVAATAYGDCTFENITVKNSKCNDYQYYAGGVVGWASGNHTFKNCNIDASTVIGGQWGDFGNSNGGVIGGISENATILLKDCNVACRIDAVNDVVSAYQYYAYRCCGMLIGNTNNSQTIDGTPYAAAPQLTCENVTVTYGDWMNYTYCEFAGTGYPYVRVQAGVSVDAYTNVRYGHPTDANGNKVVDDNHVHNAGEDHHICLPFDQLLGGGPNGNGRNPVYGLREFEGVTVNYPDSYTPED